MAHSKRDEPDFYKKIGQKGGQNTHKKYKDPASPFFDPDYYSKVGILGGNALKKLHGRLYRQYYGNLGSIKKKDHDV